jgi:hypothetical protein
MRLPFNYILDESDPDIVILRRRDGCFVAAFSASGATKQGIRKAVIEDHQILLDAHPISPALQTDEARSERLSPVDDICRIAQLRTTRKLARSTRAWHHVCAGSC